MNNNLVIHASIPPETGRRSRLVPRVFDQAKRPDVRVESYILKKALLADDRDAIVKAARNLTSEQRLEVLEQVEEIRKSGAAMPADPSRPGWTSAYWIPRNWNWNQPHPDSTAAPSYRAERWISAEGVTGKRVKVERGGIVHWVSGDHLHHGRVKSWGQQGALVVSHDGEWQVRYEDLKPGIHESAADEHRDRLAKSQAATRDREQADIVTMLSLSPEDRMAWWARRHGEDL